MSIRILDVGQCGFDGPRMAALWQDELGAEVGCADSGEEAIEQLNENKYDVVLVNRVLASDGGSGLEVIREIKDSGANVPVMLVSDLDDAQEEAVALGAVRGFGKADLGEQATLDLVASVAQGKKPKKSK